MTKKTYVLPESTIKTIHDVQSEYGFKYEVDALIYMVHEFSNRDKINDEFRKLSTTLTRLRLGVRTAEQNSIILKDLANTYLYEVYKRPDDAVLMPARGSLKHKLLIDSEDHVKEMIENAKQKKDNKKAKKGEE